MRLPPFARTLALAAAALVLTGGDFEAILKCEEAAKRLADCCPDRLATDFRCDVGCTAVPAFTPEQADCLLATDCATLRTRGACAWSPGEGRALDASGQADGGASALVCQ